MICILKVSISRGFSWRLLDSIQEKKMFSAIEDAGRQKDTCRSLSPVKTYNYNLSCAELSLYPCAFQMYSSSHSFLGLSSNHGTILNADR